MPSLDKNAILDAKAQVDRALRRGLIGAALKALDSLASLSGAPFTTKSHIAALSDSYIMMSQYLIGGTPDPSRQAMADDIAADAALTADILVCRSLCALGEPGIYLSTLRFELSRNTDTLPALLQALADAYAAQAPAAETEALATRIFHRLWVSLPIPQASLDALRAHLVSPASPLPVHDRTLLIGAILLGALQYFDPNKAILLSETYTANLSEPIGLVALTALILLLASTPSYKLGHRKMAETLTLIADEPQLPLDARAAFTILIRSRDTERVTRKITDELIPDILKMRKEIDTLAKDAAPIIDEEGEMNPQWDEILSSSGLGEKLRELSDLQNEGADVLMATMGPLKDFPFFNEPANWFLPFHEGHSLADTDSSRALAKAIAANSMICNGDKYSLLLLAKKMGSSMGPAMDGKGLADVIAEQARQEKEDMATSLPDPGKERRQAADSFVRDVYRFFRLFRRKEEFSDPFAAPINPVTTPILSAAVASDPEVMSLTAEFYFRRGHYEEALQLMEKMEETSVPTAEFFQKKGYSLEMLHRKDEALAAYETADLIDSDSVWTLRRMGHLLHFAGKNEEALAIYERIEALRPGKLQDIMARAEILMGLHRHNEALALYYQADYLKPDRQVVLHHMAMCQLITADPAKARDTLLRLRNITDIYRTPDLHFLLGVTALAMGLYQEAVDALADDLANRHQFNVQELISDIDFNMPLLGRLGVAPLTVNIISEAAIKSAASRGSVLQK
ncbi:MAG: hypothetical protein NC342_01690 [Pseudoflavonifractor sp.]|nr:hypothetical protein [Alloprevotella sp.]MCM1116235.1 hypothetical protein [Pseudoflavonifractor sp.]